MRIAFRVDSSLVIGSGHVMRCLTLADALTAQGAECRFICREHPGHMIEHIHNKGYRVDTLPVCTEITGQEGKSAYASESLYAQWLGCPWEEDSLQTKAVLSEQIPDWLIVDHYSLDKRWEMSLQGCYKKLMVVDDLANRPHVCNLLLDQNLGRDTSDYDELVPEHCQRLIGPQYALLRPEFAELREYSLQRRKNQGLKRLLISMGGVDKDNVTANVLEALKKCPLPDGCLITVVLGSAAPWIEDIKKMAENMPWPTSILVNTQKMAHVMADSDLAIGAAGSTSWERCVLGIPTIMLILADNQRDIARALSDANAAHLVDVATVKDNEKILPELFGLGFLKEMSEAAAVLTDGLGVSRVIDSLIDKG